MENEQKECKEFVEQVPQCSGRILQESGTYPFLVTTGYNPYYCGQSENNILTRDIGSKKTKLSNKQIKLALLILIFMSILISIMINW